MLSCFRNTKKESSEEETMFLMENSGLFLEKLIKSFDGKCNPIQIFSKAELARATRNYDPDQVLHKAIPYTLYKGNCEEWIILVKKFHNVLFRTDSVRDESMNEIVMLSQLNHKNVVKLLGCCLETELPVLVYEYRFNGTLADQIYMKERCESNSRAVHQVLSWENRLRIATEIAYAVTYLHTFTSRLIIHRYIEPETIILDQQGVAKLCDFSLSIPIPLGETHVQENPKKKWHSGYLPPEHWITGRVTEKTDVYCFGVLLLVIITGLEAFDPKREDRCILNYARSLLQDNRVREMADFRIKEGGGKDFDQKLQTLAELAMRCTQEIEDRRPTMIEVTNELMRIRGSKCLDSIGSS